jgi:hypothetical protein
VLALSQTTLQGFRRYYLHWPSIVLLSSRLNRGPGVLFAVLAFVICSAHTDCMTFRRWLKTISGPSDIVLNITQLLGLRGQEAAFYLSKIIIMGDIQHLQHGEMSIWAMPT